MYLHHFGLAERPFNITPDPSFLFSSRRYSEALANLLHGVRSREGFMEITGPVGTGKTTLYRALLDRLGDEVKSALVVNPCLSPSQLLQSIIEDFELQPEKPGRKGHYDALNSFLLELAETRRTAVLILDEAQGLKPGALEQIRLLSNYETRKNKLLQIILVGQPELRVMLEKPAMSQILQRIVVSVQLSALSREETEQYIEHRIMKAGGQGMLIFDTVAIDHIFTYSRGIPRLINVLCHKALMYAFMAQSGTSIIGYVEQQEGLEIV